MRTNSHQFDWYAFSKLNHESPDIQSFKQLLDGAGLSSSEIKKVPVSHRRKLLIAFQNVSKQMKERMQNNGQQLHQVQFDKKMMRDQINIMKSQLDDSMKSLNVNRMEVEEKKKSYERLKKKIEAKKEQKERNQKKQVYYCPLCARDDIKSREAFTQHMLFEHIERIKAERETDEDKKSSSIPGDVRDLILSLKDKEIQLMELMLNKKKDMETQEIERNYSEGIRRINSPKSFTERRTEYLSAKDRQRSHQDDEQLHGQSQYLFYQKDINNRETEVQKAYLPGKLKNFDRDDYYNIFPSNVVVSEHEKQIFPPQEKGQQINSHKQIRTHDQFIHRNHTIQLKNHNHVIETTQKDQNVFRNLSWDQSVQKPQDHYKAQNYSKLYNYTQNIDASSFNRRDKDFGSVYRSRKDPTSSRVTKGHVFNSGPLMDDQGGNSDYQDYFGRVQNQEVDQVQDQQIVANFSYNHNQSLPRQNKKNSYFVPPLNMQSPKSPKIIRKQVLNSYSVSQGNNSNMILEYSKDRSSLDISASKEKSSSSIVSLSNSFSRQGLQLSKDDDTINLSDLRFSKLEREKLKLKENQQNQQKYTQQINYGDNAMFKKDKMYGKKGILQQFEREQYLGSYQNFGNNSNSFRQEYQEFPQQRHPNPSYNKGSPQESKKSVLDQFMVQP